MDPGKLDFYNGALGPLEKNRKAYLLNFQPSLYSTASCNNPDNPDDNNKVRSADQVEMTSGQKGNNNRGRFPLRETLEIPSLWKVFSNRESIFRRLGWACVFLISLLLFLYQTKDRIGKLINTPKSATVKLEYRDTLDFPSITICPGYQFRQSVLNRFEAMDRYGCKNGMKECSWEFPWNMATHTETIIKYCKFKRKSCIPGTEERGKWSRRFTSLGRCFTYLPDEPVSSGGDSNALEISIDPILWDKSGEVLFNGIRVYIHEQREIPLAEINGININQGSTAHFSLRVKEYERVNEVNHNPCTQNPNYIKSKCILGCIYQSTMQQANTSCGSPFMKDFDVKICKSRKEIMFFNENFQYLVYNGSIWNGCVRQCPQICNQRTYTPITTSLGFSKSNNSLVKVRIYFTDMWLERILEEWDYNVDEFISDTGGSLNLFLGASFYTIIQVYDFILAFMGSRIGKLVKLELETFSKR